MTTTEAPKRQLWELQSMQAAPLSVKISLTKDRIREWVNQYGEDGVYVSFSGGKDSTVLLTIAREMYPDIKAVFVDTGLEYPEIRDFVRTWDNVEWLKPKLTFKQVIEKYGYPFIGKEAAQIIYECKVAINNGKQPPLYRMQKLNGEAIDKKTGEKSTYNIPQYKYLLEAPFAISHMCCKVMKKSPAHDYFKETGRKPILGQMAIESRLRRQHWLKYGCNGFDLKLPTSNPLAFWTEQDVLQYAKTRNVTLASVYGDIVNEDEDGMTYDSMFCEMPLKTTGCQRSGCMFCGFGCHLEKPGEGRFERMKLTHPKQYAYLFGDGKWIFEIRNANGSKINVKRVPYSTMMKWAEQNKDNPNFVISKRYVPDKGLGYQEVIDWLNEHGNLDIRY